LAEALYHEFKTYGIMISACCAGATATPGYLGTNPAVGFLTPSVMDPAKVASIALKKLGKTTMIIPGFLNRMSYFMLTRILPHSLASKIVNQAMKRTYRNK
jgi:short-subunit dehydrogenase